MQLGESLRRRRRSSGPGGGGLPDWTASYGRLALVATGLALGGLLFGYLFATRMLFPAPPPPGEMQTVPDLGGLPAESAAESIREAGLAVGEIEQVRHPRADSGRVIAQAPLPGQLARPGTAVRVTVSQGPERAAVPDVEGLRREWAVNLLEAAGFRVEVDSIEADEPRGQVVALEPEPGTDVELPGDVLLTVSTGPRLVAMPVLRGMTEEEARDTLRTLGLEVAEVEEVFRFGRDRGIVVEQAPPADSLLEVGTTVRFSVGRR